jgi:hypothetical protein
MSAWVFLSSITDEKNDIISVICDDMHDINKLASINFEKFWKIVQRLKLSKYFALKGQNIIKSYKNLCNLPPVSNLIFIAYNLV